MFAAVVSTWLSFAPQFCSAWLVAQGCLGRQLRTWHWLFIGTSGNYRVGRRHRKADCRQPLNAANARPASRSRIPIMKAAVASLGTGTSEFRPFLRFRSIVSMSLIHTAPVASSKLRRATQGVTPVSEMFGDVVLYQRTSGRERIRCGISVPEKKRIRVLGWWAGCLALQQRRSRRPQRPPVHTRPRSEVVTGDGKGTASFPAESRGNFSSNKETFTLGRWDALGKKGGR